MKVLKFSFLFYSIFLVLGILSAEYLKIMESGIGLLISSILLFLFCFKFFYKRLSTKPYFFLVNSFLFSVSCFLLGNVAMHIQEIKRSANNVISSKIIEEDNVYEILLKSKLKSTTTYNRYIGDVNTINDESTRGKVVVQIKSDSIRLGDVIMVKGKLQAFSSVKNIGQFNYSKYMQSQGIEGQFFVQDYTIVGKQNSYILVINSWRAKLLESIQNNSELSTYSKGFVSALLLGDRGGIDDLTQNAFKELGVMHVLAISGLHIGIIYMFMLVVLERAPKRIRTIAIVLFLWLFVFLSGFSPSVFRAVLMFTALAIAKGLNRNTTTMHIVSLSFFLSLLFKPTWLFDVGFQLSYTAVFGIVWIMPLFKRFRHQNRIVRYIIGLLLVSLVAQVSVLPLQLYYFGQLPTFFLPANLFVIPLVTVIIITGIIWMAINPISVFLGDYIAKGINILIDGLVYGVQFINQQEWVSSISLMIDARQAALLGVFLFSIVLFMYQKRKRILFVSVFVLLLIQVDYAFKRDSVVQQEWVVPYGFRKNVEVLDRVGGDLVVYTDSLDYSRTALTDYRKENVIADVKVFDLPYYYKVQSNFVLHLTEEMNEYHYASNKEVTHILFSGKVKLNFDRVITELQPQEIIIHNSVPYWIKNYIVNSCEKRKIPYHDISNKGFYRLSL